MATTGLKVIYATELDADDSTNEEQELGCLRFGVDGIVYRYVQAGTTGWSTGNALVESTAGTDTVLIPAPITAARNNAPIVAFGQSTITAAYYGWVIWKGKVANAVADESFGAEGPLRGPILSTGTAGRIRRSGAGAESVVSARTAATGAGSTVTVEIR